MAEHAHTTTSRRALIGAGAATLLLAAPAAGDAKARELDGELIAACCDLARHQARWRVIDDRVLRNPPIYTSDDECNALHDAWWRAIERVRSMPARTPEGVVAKAGAVLLVLQHCSVYEWEADNATPTDVRIACDFLRELSGGIGA